MRKALPAFSYLAAPPFALTHVRDIEWFEGPLLSEFEALGGQRYLLCWRDMDDEYNRWLVLWFEPEQLRAYEAQEVPLISFWLAQKNVFLVDTDRDGKFARWALVDITTLPKSYWPTAEAMHDPALAPPTSCGAP